MVMKKVINSTDAPVIVSSTSTDKNLFPPGFRYRLGSLIFTIKSDCTQEINSPMREVFLSDGATEIVPVETLIKDICEIDKSNGSAGEIMEPDERFIPKRAADTPKKKVTKRKTAKKKTTKK